MSFSIINRKRAKEEEKKNICSLFDD